MCSGLAASATLACEASGPLDIERVFVSETVENRALVPDSRLRVRMLGDATLSFDAGCTTYGSDRVRLRDGRLRFRTLSAGVRRCDEAYKDQDAWLVGFLWAGPAFELEGDRLTLRGDGVTVVLRERGLEEIEQSLQATPWILDATYRDDGGWWWGEGIAEGSIVFEDDGVAVIGTPCGAGTARFAWADGELELRDLDLRREACELEGHGLIDRHVAQVLGKPRIPWYLDELGRLRLGTTRDGLGFHPAPRG